MSDYSKLKRRHFPKEELFIKSEIQNPVLKEFLNRLEKEYGCLLTNTGCTIDGKWLSVKAITVLVSELDKELIQNDRKAVLQIQKNTRGN